MRRMNYPRFDKPVNFGTFNEDRAFILDHEPEVGIYLAQIKDEGAIYSVICTFSDTESTHACWYGGAMAEEIVQLFYTPGDGNELGTSPNAVHAGSTIELYKLN